jgi:hypothetical protein
MKTLSTVDIEQIKNTLFTAGLILIFLQKHFGKKVLEVGLGSWIPTALLLFVFGIIIRSAANCFF